MATEARYTLGPAGSKDKNNVDVQYNTLAAFISGEGRDISQATGSDEYVVIEFYGGDYGGTFGGLDEYWNPSQSTWQTDLSTDNVIIFEAGPETAYSTGGAHNGKSRANGGTGFLLYQDEGFASLYGKVACSFNDLEVMNVGTSGVIFTAAGSDFPVQMERCLMYSSINSTKYALLCDDVDRGARYLIDCLLVLTTVGAGAGIDGRGSSDPFTIRNTLVYGGGYGIQLDGGYELTNSGAVGQGTFGFSGSPGSSVNSYSGDSSAPAGGTTVTSVPGAAFVNAVATTAGDFTPVEGGVLEDAGINTYSQSTIDLASNPRPAGGPFDLGPLEIVGAAGPSISVQPDSATVTEPNAADFSVTASGTGTLIYQWKLNGANVGTDSANYNTGPTTESQNGYVVTVDVTDDNSTTTSDGDAVLTVNAAAPDTITLTDYSESELFCRDKATDVADVTVSGTYSGSPTSIQARIVLDGTSTVVVDWVSIDASPAGGVFSGTVSVPSGGKYNAQVRYGNDAGVTDGGTSGWFVGIGIAVAGQSNAANLFNSSGYAGYLNPSVVVSTSQSWGPLTTDMPGGATIGDIINQESGIPVGLFNYGVGGSGILNWINTGDPNWQAMQTAINASGGQIEAAIWDQGEQDAVSGMSTAVYRGHLETVVANFRSAFANASDQTATPVIIGMVGKDGGTSTAAHFEHIRIAQGEVTSSDVNAYQVTRVDLATSLHLDTAGYATYGGRLGNVYDYILGLSAYWHGPQISAITVVDSTTVDVVVTQSGGTNLIPDSGITGFEVTDDGFSTTKTITSAVKLSTTVLRLVFTEPLVGVDAEVRYLYGNNPDTSGAVYDNTALDLPLEWEDSVASCDCYASIVLTDEAGTPSANITGLSWVWFDQATPDAFSAPIDQGSGATTDGGGLFSVPLIGSALAPGGTGWLVVTDSDGTTTQDPAHKAFSGPVTVS